MRMLRGIVDVVSKKRAGAARTGAAQHGVGGRPAVARDADRPARPSRRHEDGPPLMEAVVSRMTDSTIARFVSRNVISADTSTDRLAQAFQTLVRDEGEQQRLLALAHDDVAASPLGSTEGFESVWNHVAEKLLTSYSDEPFVSEAYGTRAVGRAHPGDRGRRRQRRSAGAHQRLARHGRHDRAARARSDAAARSAAHRARRGSLGRADDAGRRR